MIEIVRRVPRHGYLQVRSDWVKLCDGDHCRASLIRAMEYLTDAALSSDGKTVDEIPETLPVVSASLKQIADVMVGLFERRKIQRELKWLSDQGWVEILSSDNGKPGQYRLNASAIDTAIGRFFDPGNPVQKDSVPSTKALGTQCKSARSGPSNMNTDKQMEDGERAGENQTLSIIDFIRGKAAEYHLKWSPLKTPEIQHLKAVDGDDLRARIAECFSLADAYRDNCRTVALDAAGYQSGRKSMQRAAPYRPPPKPSYQSPPRRQRATTAELNRRSDEAIRNLP